MCRRRILAIILSLALVASCFVISVSADNTEFDNFLITINGTSYPLVEGAYTADFIVPANGTLTVSMTTFGSTKGSFSGAPIVINFIAQPYIEPSIYSGDITSSNIFASNFVNANTTNINTYTINTDIIDYNNALGYYKAGEYTKCTYAFYVGGYVTNNYHSLGQSCIWNNTSNGSVSIRYRFEQVNITVAGNWFYGQILMPAIANLQSTLNYINSAVQSLNTAFVINDNYSYNTIYYDQDGNAHVQEVLDVNWIDSIQGMLFALSQPVVHQVEQEQMARDAGFEDVLDDAYDKSNPGSFLDLLDIGDLADWNEQSFSGSLSDGFLYWFSQSCADDIDTVPVVRGEEPQVIDFYTQHMNDYWEALTDGTADQGGD